MVATDTWVTRTSMPTARKALAVAATTTRLFAVGGDVPSSPAALGTLEMLTFATDVWASRKRALRSFPALARMSQAAAQCFSPVLCLPGAGPHVARRLRPVTRGDTILHARWHLHLVCVCVWCVCVCVCIIMSCRELHADCAAPVRRDGRERHHVRRGRLPRPDVDRKTRRAVLGRHRHVGHRSARLQRDQPNRCPHLHHPCHICIRSGLTPAISALGAGSPLPYLH